MKAHAVLVGILVLMLCNHHIHSDEFLETGYSIKYMTLETENFLITCQEGDEYIAQDVAEIAEDAFLFDTQFMSFCPKRNSGCEF